MSSANKICFVVFVCLFATHAGDVFGEQPLSFNADIRSILSDKCFACHGPDAEERAADLRLDQRASAIKYGAVVAGEPGESLLVDRIFSDDPDLIMPPPESHKTLTDAEKTLLKDWIRQGAEYQKHWSFEPLPKSIAVPPVLNNWPSRTLDAFVAKSHRKKSLTPAAEADRSTWLRRVTYDLTGLPPTLAELDGFESDEAADAYEKVVDRLLDSPAYGERMAVMWLDVARYADTFGYQNDIAMEVWPWRQWVIDAFNRNMPYDQFVTEQIAGDLIPDATVQQRLATTFSRLHRQTNEGGSVAEEFRLTGINDRTTTAGTAFLGLTMECCRCHDHKFDPLAQEDFYALSAYFSDIDEFGLYAHFTFSAPTPALLLYEGDQKEKHLAVKKAVAAAEANLQSTIQLASKRWNSNNRESNQTLPEPRRSKFHLQLDGDAEGVVGKATRCNGDKEISCKDAPRFGRTSPFTFSIWARPAIQTHRMVVLHQSRAAEDAGFRGLELTIDDGHPQFSMVHFWPGNAVRIRAVDPIPVQKWSQLAVTHDGSGRADGIQLFVNGRSVPTEVIRDKLTRDIRHRKDWGDMQSDSVGLALGARFRDIGFRDGLLDDLNVYDVQLSSAEIASIYSAVRS